MATRDGPKQLDTVLSYLVGRRLSTKELCEALEMSRTTYYEQRQDARLICADNLIRAARNLGLNEVDLLVRYGLIAAGSAVEYVEEISSRPLVGTKEKTQTRRGASIDLDAPGL
ncbi:hypothetical protein [Mycobacterium paraense]|uniref:hypothetical protein n=1 Tax=Mycobacterium paraense TaxID=767916 RepID=UPI001F4E548F|nr:hypothetical protein [Mycobacterium paraense]